MTTIANRRREQAAAAKKRRKTIFVIVGLCLLVVVMAIQIPKMLDLLSSETSAVAPVPTTASTNPTTSKPNPEAARLLASQASVDPFVTRALADGDPPLVAVAAPPGAHDPFLPVATKTVLAPKRIIIGTPTSGRTPTVGYIVVLASIRTGAGRALAERIAARAAKDGIGETGVLDSSTRRPLRAGYYVAYVGPFTSGSAVRAAADRARALGYRTAYIRELIQY